MPPRHFTVSRPRVGSRRRGRSTAPGLIWRGNPDDWQRGGVWTHQLGQPNVKIGLVSMGGRGFIAQFDYVRTFRLIAGEPGGWPT